MPTTTYTPLATTTLATPVASVTFSNIPNTYRDLILKFSWRVTSAATSADSFFRFNGDTGSNYSHVWMAGTTSAISGSGTQTFLTTNIDSPTIYTLNTTQIFDYATTDKFKAGMMQEGDPSYAVWCRAFRWASTSAITSISITASDRTGSGTPDNFDVGSIFSIYGVIA